jgi:hypothetical protein
MVLVGVSSNTQALLRGQGFAAWCGDNLGGTAPFVIDVFNGAPHIATAPITLPMSWTNTGNPTVDGWNLVSNPVPSAIAFDQIARGADVQDYVTFYNPANGNMFGVRHQHGLRHQRRHQHHPKQPGFLPESHWPGLGHHG